MDCLMMLKYEAMRERIRLVSISSRTDKCGLPSAEICGEINEYIQHFRKTAPLQLRYVS